jgi:hypothetical protein
MFESFIVYIFSLVFIQYGTYLGKAVCLGENGDKVDLILQPSHEFQVWREGRRQVSFVKMANYGRKLEQHSL